MIITVIILKYVFNGGNIESDLYEIHINHEHISLSYTMVLFPMRMVANSISEECVAARCAEHSYQPSCWFWIEMYVIRSVKLRIVLDL